MDYDERIEYINQLQEKPYKNKKSPATIILNFYTLVTIVLVSIAILLYSNYLLPSFEAKKQNELQVKEKQEYLEKRRKQIELSHKLNKTNIDNKKGDHNGSK